MTTELEQCTALNPGEHLCHLHDGDAERSAIVAAFLRRGLEEGQRCICIAAGSHGADAVDALGAAGFDVEAAIAAGALWIVSPAGKRLSGRLEVDRIVSLVREAAGSAREDGFHGLRIASEMGWALERALGVPRVVELETAFGEAVREHSAIALCQYDRALVPAGVQRDVLRTHPIAVLGEQVCPNIFFEPRKLVLGSAGDDERVEWKLAQLRRARAAQRECEAALAERDRSVEEARTAAAERERLLEELRANDLRKDEFLAMLGHELRNPLGAISNGLQVLRRRTKTDESTRQERDVLDRQVKQMARLLDDLLDVSRITRGLTQLDREQLDLASVVARAVATTAPLMQSRRHQFGLSLPPEPLPVEGDACRLEQVLVNLLSNAAKYTDPGGVVSLSVKREEGQAVVRVRDNGQGIPGDLLPRIFDMFTQGERSLDRSQGGLGIGLTLARRLVELHGGSIEANSEGTGSGSEFVVRLPALVPSLGGARLPRLDAEVARAASSAPRLLLVEDNVDAAAMLFECLQMLGYQVHVAHDGPSGLELAARIRPDVCLLDIGLPGMDGYEVAQRLRRDPHTRGAYLIALTGYGQESDRRRSKQAGFDQHLVKPVDIDELDRVITSAKDRQGRASAVA